MTTPGSKCIACLKCAALLIACSLTLTQFCYAGSYAIDDSTKHKLFSSKIQLQASVGIASTNFSFPYPGYGNLYLYFIHADLFLIKKVSVKSDVRIGIAYEPVGYINDRATTENSFHTKYRHFYGNLHALYGYQLSGLARRIDFRVFTGVFAGRLMDNDIVALIQPGNVIDRTKDVTTYIPWNAGVSLGLSGSIPITRKSALGLKLIYHAGTISIYNQESTSRTGIKRYTRSIGLSTFFNF